MRKLKITELNRLTSEAFKMSPKIKIAVVLDNIRSLHNVGSLFRTSDALSLEALFLCGITATPPHNDIHKTALGAEDSMKWFYYERTEDAIEVLRKNGYKIIGLEQVENSTCLTQFKANKGDKYAVVVGNEVKGVSQQVLNQCDLCLEIPQFGTKHSLNVSVSGAIALWEIAKQMHPALAQNS